jgi:hypothetical protein
MWAAWHGRGMVLAWGISIPLGILIARYFKITPSQRWPAELDNKFWWRWHRILQYCGVAISLAAIYPAYVIASESTVTARIHGWLGWAVIGIGVGQILGAWARGTKGGPTGERSAKGDWSGDHYDMTRRRLAFEYLHKFVGLSSLLVAAVAILLGLFVADAPRWMFVVIFAWWVGLAVAAAYLQSHGRCIDTYQAIWGPEPRHPGNQRRPIGIGVHHVAAEAQPAPCSTTRDEGS